MQINSTCWSGFWLLEPTKLKLFPVFSQFTELVGFWLVMRTFLRGLISSLLLFTRASSMTVTLSCFSFVLTAAFDLDFYGISVLSECEGVPGADWFPHVSSLSSGTCWTTSPPCRVECRWPRRRRPAGRTCWTWFRPAVPDPPTRDLPAGGPPARPGRSPRSRCILPDAAGTGPLRGWQSGC